MTENYPDDVKREAWYIAKMWNRCKGHKNPLYRTLYNYVGTFYLWLGVLKFVLVLLSFIGPFTLIELTKSLQDEDKSRDEVRRDCFVYGSLFFGGTALSA
eukprot:CAMPEP_0115043678 /NCGR_PEP_ID=MMETSP0216-20121206/47009_1 /TAXON_ID=223996 /ORGANISM="Protocruzia adherens, Strain Boccale" /LENGTH=99 /DNA_ID=CAMNT_0002426039 /DNA_START=187 /DNA_END=483 /DNA_ORIENTATION=-